VRCKFLYRLHPGFRHVRPAEPSHDDTIGQRLDERRAGSSDRTVRH
jgi:hypothetical protein